MPNTETVGTTGRGGLLLYGEVPVERAWALTHKVANSNGVYRPQNRRCENG
nr:MAG TPA: hypothetical protein [Caudoviricetes sp.]